MCNWPGLRTVTSCGFFGGEAMFCERFQPRIPLMRRLKRHTGSIRLGVLLAVAIALPLCFPPNCDWRHNRSGQAWPGTSAAWLISSMATQSTWRAPRIRLNGIDAPESPQTCLIASRSWRCGAAATDALAGILRGHDVRCEPTGIDRYHRALAHCRRADDNLDINGWMVREGWAVAYRQYSYAYMPDEMLARLAGRGLLGRTRRDAVDFRHHARAYR